MHQPTPSTHRNRRHMCFTSQVAAERVECVQEHGIFQLACNNPLDRIFCTPHIASPRCATQIAPHLLRDTGCTTGRAPHRLHHFGCTKKIAPH
eukprot:1604601-Pyramimonas_sp.AAC.1